MNPPPSDAQISSHPIHLHDWPHAPSHRTQQPGAYIVTAATYQKALLFKSAYRLTLLSNSIFDLAEAYALQLQAWAIFANHYHLIADCPVPQNLKKFTRHLHSSTAIAINKEDNSAGRKVWFQYRESHLTFQRSYFARLVTSTRIPSATVSSASRRAIPGAQLLGSRAKPVQPSSKQ